MPEALIGSLARTPIGRAGKGSLAGERADDLATLIARSALARMPELDPSRSVDLSLGASRHTGEQSQNLARRVAVQLGLDGLPGVTVNRGCVSSLQAVRMAALAVRVGEGEAYLAAGVESVSRYRPDPDGTGNPLFDEAQARTADHPRRWTDPRGVGSLPDVYIAMGETAENVADLYGVTREARDQYALRSQRRTAVAVDAGHLAREITPYAIKEGVEVIADDSPRPGTTLEALRGLKPVFRPCGSVTVGNSCPLNDGAAAAVLVSGGLASELHLEPVARVVATALSGISPEIMGMGPVLAVRRVLEQARWSMDDVDLFEINEAFAAQVIPCAAELGIPAGKLNVLGGSIALGHPFGMTGIRLCVTAMNALEILGGRRAVVSTCVGTGQGMAMAIERLQG